MAILKTIWGYFAPLLSSWRTYTFEERFKHARYLLDFAITEGATLDEDVIDVIDGAELETVDRIQFDKAYRRLVEAVTPVTWSSLRFSSMPKWMLLGIAFILTGAIWLMRPALDFADALGMVAGLFVLIWFLDIFTGIVTKKRMIEIIVFCYLFTFVAVIGPVALFFGAFISAPELQQSMKENAMGLLRGCSRQREVSWVPEEIRCRGINGTASSQWVLNIGGTVVTGEGGLADQPGSSGDVQEKPHEKEKVTAALPGHKAEAKSTPPAGPVSRKPQRSPVVIDGGIVVPLYVIVLALMGGAVSMTRRVPEYQRRVYLPASDPEYITRERGRELLVFQIMQVLSAPLIAIAAYYTIKPADITVSVLLGFSSGFASETILLAIRALVTKLNPLEPKKDQSKKDA